ncbi:peptidylprolyl isomerase [Candidatus Uhrbacteria bacterium]|nr:peptidylprolyl isomerase [Candidatus Uhrbacteria bacterium]
MERLVSVEVLDAEAAKRGVSVSGEDIDAEFAKLSAAGGGGIEQQIKDLYGWTTAQFKDKVVRPYLLTQKLAEALAKDPELAKERFAKANEVLDKLKAGEKFEDLAAKYSGDPSHAQNGGDLGWFGKGVMVPEFENGVFSLKKGETSGLIETKFGTHIVLLEDIKKAKDGSVEQVKARHILISAPNIDEFIKQAVENAKVRKFVK